MRFLLIDRFVKLTQRESVVALKSMSGNIAKNHFPHKRIIPGTLLIESFAQIASWLVIYACRFRYGIVLAMLRDSLINGDILPGDRIECRARIVSIGESVSEVEAEGYINRKLVARSDVVYSHLVAYTQKERMREINRFNYLTGMNIKIGDLN